MNIRAAKIMVAIIATILSSANAFAAPEDAAPAKTEQPADRCLTSPRDYAPPGTRWRYRVERGTGRHCWFLKDDAEKAAGKAREPSTTAEEDAAPAPRKKAAAPRSLSDAHAEFSKTPVEQKIEPTPAQSPPAETASAPAPATSAAAGGSNLTSSANMLAPTAATRWPDPMATMPQANPAATSPALPAQPVEQTAEVRAAPAAAPPPPRPQTMPRVVPPVPASEKPMSMPMLITIVAGGLSVLGVLVSLLFAWLSSRRARLAPIEPMPPLEMPDELRRPGDLYRERKRLRAQKSGWRAA